MYSIDLDNDGDNDVLSASSTDNKIAWYENDGLGNFGNQQILPSNAMAPFSVYSIDLDNDGDNDVLSASSTDNKIAWYENDGLGNFGSTQIISTDAEGANSVFSVDLDNDGDYDVLSSSWSDNKIAWYVNDGDGNFGDQQIISTYADGASSVYSIDLDSDGDNDVLSASGNDDKIAWYENYFNSKHYFYYEICTGDSIYVFEEWLSEPGVYSSTYQNSLGGDSIVIVTIDVMPLPEDFTIIGTNEVEEFSTQTYSVPSNPDVQYSFEVENGNILSTLANSVEIQWGTNSMGLVKAIATFPETGCDNQSTLEVTVGTGDINEYNQSKVRVFPNPAKNILNIESELPGIFIEILNQTGIVLLQSKQLAIDISDLSAGTYFAKVYNKKGNILCVEKIIVNR